MSKAKNQLSDVSAKEINRSDIEDGLRSLHKDVESAKVSAQGAVIAGGILVALLLIFLALVLGKKIGKKNYAFVEIRRA